MAEECFNEQGYGEGEWNIGPCTDAEEVLIDDFFMVL